MRAGAPCRVAPIPPGALPLRASVIQSALEQVLPESLSENSNPRVGAEVTRLPMLWKPPGLAVEEVDLLTSAPTFQTRSEILQVHEWVFSYKATELLYWKIVGHLPILQGT